MRIFDLGCLIALAATLSGACLPKDSPGSDDESATISDDSTSTASPPPTSTGGTDDADASATGDDATTASDADGCEALCAREDACSDAPDPDCLENCREAGALYAFIGADCHALYTAYTACMSAATCEALDGHPRPCDEVLDLLIDEACTLPVCAAMCGKQIECGWAPDGAQIPCAFDCSTALGRAAVTFGDECVDIAVTALECESTLTCDQIDQTIGCEEEIAAASAPCD